MPSSNFIHGCQPVCKACRHLDQQMRDRGHPAPCAAVKWIQNEHVSPTIDAGECDRFGTVDQTRTTVGVPVG